MGFFENKNPEANTENGVSDCKLCGLPLSGDNFSNDLGLCDSCLIQTNNYLKNIFNPSFEKYLTLAENETSLENKVSYLRDALDVLYGYKIKYYDNGVDFLDQDIDDMIDDLVDQISKIRL
jgi:hypothetical protein